MDEAKLADFMGRIVTDMGGAVTVTMVQLGNELGLYEALDGKGYTGAAALAANTGCHPRLIQEWLDQQAAAGYLEYDAATERYALPEEHAMALARRQSPMFVAAGASVLGAMVHDLDPIAEAFRGDGAMPWGAHHPSLFKGTAEFFRPGYQANLTTQWIPALTGVEAKLRSGARIADIGCGHGISSVVMAQTYGNCQVHGFDLHPPSIEAARAGAEIAEVSDRTHFRVADAQSFDGEYDLICFFDCLHDMGDPVGIARYVRERLAPGGTVMLVEPFAHDDKATNLKLPTAKLFYGASSFICAPNSLSQPVGLAMGAQSGEHGMRGVFEEAGYSEFRRAAETPFNLVYEARP